MNDQGNFHCWLYATGACNLRKMNSLVDLLGRLSIPCMKASCSKGAGLSANL
ncbi:hypothetical protein BJX70DRAFT_371715 [Aspergillus crustosus]